MKVNSIKKKPHSKMSEENCYEKDWQVFKLTKDKYTN